MVDSPSIISGSLDYSFLLLTHMVCADQQIHNKELNFLGDLESKWEIKQNIIREKEKILIKDEECLSLEDIAHKIPSNQQKEVMDQMLIMAGIDGFFAPQELEMVKQVAQIWRWNFNNEDLKKLKKKAENSVYKLDKNNKNNKQKLSISTRIYQGIDSLFSRRVVNRLTELNLGAKKQVKQWQEELFQQEYQNALSHCTKIADEDYKYARKALRETESELKKLKKNLQKAVEAFQRKTGENNRASTAKQIAQQLEETKESLNKEIIKSIASVQDSLNSKQRTLRNFTIAFIGKTKSGKSTLHAIMTEEEWDAIGEGKQRTTRYNRVYEWEGIRIIDTPGIGAAEEEGRTDEEIAQTIIDESDVIYYLVTNDSQQETDFCFLRLLQEKNKPLIILLNVKYNLDDSWRLEEFLEDPEELFQDVKEHNKRIKDYADKYHNHFEIIPVMLYAAHLARHPDIDIEAGVKDKLYSASKMPIFLASIRKSIVDFGVLRRSQTLLGSTVGNISNPRQEEIKKKGIYQDILEVNNQEKPPYQWIEKEVKKYKELTKTIRKKNKNLKKEIKEIKKEKHHSLEQQINNIFLEFENSIPALAENHWKASEEQLNNIWKKQTKHLNERLESTVNKISKEFNNEVKEAIEEIGKDLKLIAQLKSGQFTFSVQDTSTFWRDFFHWGGIILQVGGLIVNFVNPIAGLVVRTVGRLVGAISHFFKDKNQKRKEAIHNLSNVLKKELNATKQETLNKALPSFDKGCEDIANAVDNYFEDLIAGMNSISQKLEIAQNNLSAKVELLNRAYAKRIIDWCSEHKEVLTDETINQNIVNVQRDFGYQIEIKTTSKPQLKKSLEELQQVLQENISIQ